MKASPGDWLVVETPTVSSRRREGLITEVLGGDGGPPYRVRWGDTGREGLLYPGPSSHIQHFDHETPPG